MLIKFSLIDMSLECRPRVISISVLNTNTQIENNQVEISS